MSEKEKDATHVVCKEEAREERKFRHRIGYMAMVTACSMLLSFVFIIGWSVIVQGKDLAEGPVGSLLENTGHVLKLIFW